MNYEINFNGTIGNYFSIKTAFTNKEWEGSGEWLGKNQPPAALLGPSRNI